MSDFNTKCTEFNFGWGFAPDPTRKLTALSRPLAVFKGLTSREGDGRGGKGSGGKGGKGEGYIQRPNISVKLAPLPIAEVSDKFQICRFFLQNNQNIG